MSDQHSEKPDDYDAIFGPDETEVEVIDAETVESRIDDYEDIDDGDEDAGIFANEAGSSRKKGGMSSAIVLLSVATLAFGGVGAYFALSGSDTVAPEIPVITPPVPETTLSQADTPIPAPAVPPEQTPVGDAQATVQTEMLGGAPVESPAETPAASPNSVDVAVPVDLGTSAQEQQEVSAEIPPIETGSANAPSAAIAPTEPMPPEMAAADQGAPDSAPAVPAAEVVVAENADVPANAPPAKITAVEGAPELPLQDQAETKPPEPVETKGDASQMPAATIPTENAEIVQGTGTPVVSMPDANKVTPLPEGAVAEKTPTTEAVVTNVPNGDIGTPPVVAADSAVIDVTNGAVPPQELTEVKVTPEVVPDAGVKASVVDAPKPDVSAPPAAELSKADTVKAEDKKGVAPSATAKAKKDDIVLDEKPPEEKVPKTVYYDAPSGRILGDLPAPSLNLPKNAKESMIVVNSNGGKVTSSKSAVETTDLESKIIAANRALRLERYDAAKEMYGELYALNPKDGRILMGRAVLFQKIGENDKAIATYEEILDVNPENTEAIVNLTGLIRKQYPAVALNKLLDLKQKFPENPAVLAQLGVAYADSQNYEPAIESLRQAARFDPRNAKHYFNMAIIAERMSERKAAISYYEKALEVDAIYGAGRTLSRDVIYDRLARLRGE